MSNFKNIILKLRKERGFNQEQLAKELRVSKSTIGMWETGGRLPSSELYEQIADYFNVDIDYLYGRTSIRQKIHYNEDGTEYATNQNNDSDMVIIQRERSKMTEKEKTKLMNILRANFDDYNWEEDDSGNID
ncbi:MAG: helix-turn-helix domain-containing protein [Clostridium sp.]|nr:helix-turn-helix domain-containing protein [Clostridium sp.]MCM1459707.1 helix-turn-helix domain-containing protein [Bacteroides sp.]